MAEDATTTIAKKPRRASVLRMMAHAGWPIRAGLFVCRLSSECERRQRLEIRHHIEHDRPIRLDRAVERGGKLARSLDADAQGADLLGDAREVDFFKGPQLARLLGLLAAVSAVE